MITKLPDDVLSHVLQHLYFQEKCTLQLVCRRLNALLSSPHPGLWGQLNLVIDIINRKQTDRNIRQVTQSPTLLRMP